MSDFRELLEFFRIGSEDLAALAEQRSEFEANADAFVDEFYEHLQDFAPTAALLEDEGVRQRLLGAQRDYLLSLAKPEIDESYVQDRARIGAAHERVGLHTKWYLGAYALYFSLLFPMLQRSLKHDPDGLARVVPALVKRLVFDSEIAIDQYIDHRERQLRDLNRELEAAGRKLSKEVVETTRDLRNTEARAQAAEQLASVATLVTGLAHEIGTPMGVIRGHAEALEGTVEGERAQWRLNMILEQIDRITNIIQSLLNIARPKESLWVPLDLPELLVTSLAFLTEKLKRRGVEVRTEVGEVPNINGDPEKIQQIFLNLFLNAVDAMPDGGELFVSLQPEDDEVVIRIADCGTGIGPDDLEQIFDPFYTTKDAGHGNGLGLVVVKGIVSDHDGEIAVRSELGEGTEFTIRFPAALEDRTRGE